MGTRTNLRRSRAHRRGLATFVSFLLLFAFALGQSSLIALADGAGTDPVADETVADEAAPDATAPAEEPPAEEPPAEEPPAEELPAEEPPAEEPPSGDSSDGSGASSGSSSGAGAAATSSDGATSSKDNVRDNRNAALAGDEIVIQSHGGLHGGDVGLDFVAAGPFTYDHNTGLGTYPDFGFNDRTIDKDTGVVESLESGDFECDDLVTFFTQVSIDDGADGSGTVVLNYSFGNETTGQPGLGFTDIISVAVNTPDDGNVGNVNDNVATLSNEFIETQGYNELHGTVTVTNLAPGEVAIVRVIVELSCFPGSPTGNILSTIESATADGDTVPVGQQTVPMKVTGFTGVPSISIVKDCPLASPFGEDIVYEITITNDGSEDLVDVEVTDTVNGNPPVVVPGFSTTLDQGESETVLFTYSPTGNEPDPLPNSATVTAEGDVTATVVTDTDNCTTDITHVPGIDVTKSCPESVPFGEEIEYTITVENTGNEPLVGVTVIDDILGDITADFDFDFTDPFPVDEVATATVFYTPLPGDPDPLINTVTATGNGEDSGAEASDTAECTTDITHEPGLLIVKECPTEVAFGEDVVFEFELTNTGNEPLENVLVTDALLGGDITAAFNLPDPLPVGTTVYTASISYTPGADEDPVENSVTATGVGVDSGDMATSSDECSTDILNPAIDIVKTVDEDTVPVGTTVTYTYVITNTGDATLFDVSVDDDILGHIGDIAVLEPGQSVTMTKDFVVGDAPVVNVAIAEGEDILGRSVSADDDALVTPIIGNPPPPPTPFTGSDASRLAMIAIGLFGLGATLVAATRRRRARETA